MPWMPTRGFQIDRTTKGLGILKTDLTNYCEQFGARCLHAGMQFDKNESLPAQALLLSCLVSRLPVGPATGRLTKLSALRLPFAPRSSRIVVLKEDKIKLRGNFYRKPKLIDNISVVSSSALCWRRYFNFIPSLLINR